MNRFFIVLVLLACSGLIFAQNSERIDIRVTGTLSGFGTSDKVFLFYRNDDKRLTDSVKVDANGAFELEATVDEFTLANLYAGKSLRDATRARNISFYLDSTLIKIASTDSLRTAEVKGGQTNVELDLLNKALKDAEPLHELSSKKYKSASSEERKSPAFIEEINQLNRNYNDSVTAILVSFVEKNPNSFVSLDKIRKITGNTPDASTLEPYFNRLSDAFKQTKKGRELALQIEKARETSVGAQAPAFTQANTEGKNVSLSDYKGKYVLLDFWASWCGPCRKENPHVVKAFAELKEHNFTVLGVSLDQAGKKDNWLKAIQDDGLEWEQVSDLQFWDNEVAKLYNIKSIPQNFL